MSSLRRATIGVAAFTGLNMALGYVRDVGIAAQFGSSDLTDAFFAGTFLPLLIYLVALTGSLIPAFLPTLAAEYRRGPGARPWRLAALVAGVVTALGAGVVAGGWALAGPVVGALAAGYPPAKLALAVDLFRLSLPMLVPLGPAAVISALLNYHNRFLAPAAAAAAFNATVLASLVLFGGALGIRSVALGMGLGGFVQLLALLPALWQVRQTDRPPPTQADSSPIQSPQSAIRNPQSAMDVGRLALPLLLTVGVAQGVAVAERFLASHLGEGALSVLNYAMKLNQLPILLFAGALTTVLFPTLSRHALEAGAAGDGGAFAARLGRGLGQVVGWTAPAAAWLIVCAEPVVRVVYERQRFSPADSTATARVLALYAVGLVPLALNVLLPRAYHARRDMRTPLLATAAGTALYIALAVVGANLAGAPGLALALGLANAVQMILLLAGLRRVLAGVWAGLLAGAARSVGLAAGLGLGCWGLLRAADGTGLLHGPFVVQALTLAGLALAGAAIYGGGQALTRRAASGLRFEV
jgi:putative peptidoglycan lipid II flippase